MNALMKPVNFIKEVKAQLIKVSWPTKNELVGSTSIVITITFITAVFIGFIDLILSRILSWLFR